MAALGWASPALAKGFPPVAYREGVAFPARQADLDHALVAHYRDWKALYLTEGCGEGRAYVAVDADGKWRGGDGGAGTLTVSEAHGYGMLALVMMAPVDKDAHRLFDAMVRFRRDHPAAGHAHLMAWKQVTGCGNAGADDGGDHSATDGDLDIAYALLMAEKRWGDGGKIDYGAEARATLAAILGADVTPDSVLLIGDWARDGPTFGQVTRSSDLMMSHFQSFAAATGEDRWRAVRSTGYRLLAAATAGLGTGLSPDFITGVPLDPKPAPPDLVEGPGDGFQAWNAMRTPWRLALDDVLFGAPEAHTVLSRYNRFLVDATGGDPARLADVYRLDGQPVSADGPPSLAAVAMAAAATLADPEAHAWQVRLWRELRRRPADKSDYYGNTLKLMALITLAGHWEKP